MDPEHKITLNPAYEATLQLWAEKVKNTWEEDVYNLWESKEGLQTELVGVYHWAYDVKVRRPWKLLGTETLELHGIFESGQRFPIIDSMSAEELIEATLGSRLVSLPRNIEENGWVYDLTYCDNAEWAEMFGGGNLESPLFRRLDLSEELWSKMPLPFGDGDKVSRSILGFEGGETTLASIHYWNNMFLDGASGPADGYLNTIELLKPPVLKLNDETVPDAQVQPMLARAAELFSQGVHR